MKKALPAILAVVILAVGIFWLLGDDIEHIPDTNGDDNYTLEVITDENIIALDTGSLGVSQQWDSITNTESYSSKCFTGVYEIFYENIITNRYEVTVNHAKVTGGNFKMVLLVNDEIVHTFTLNELTQTYILENVKGTVSLRIAGESAEFMFDYYLPGN